jgi:hypothetical protein
LSAVYNIDSRVENIGEKKLHNSFKFELMTCDKLFYINIDFSLLSNTIIQIFSLTFEKKNFSIRLTTLLAHIIDITSEAPPLDDGSSGLQDKLHDTLNLFNS